MIHNAMNVSDVETPDAQLPVTAGIPILLPGERLTAAKLDVILSVKANNGKVTGATDGSFQQANVIA